jgi:hypothetical protein
MPAQQVAAPLALLALKHALLLQLEQDDLEEFPGDALPGRQVGDEDWTSPVVAGQPDHGQEAVFCLHREHRYYSTKLMG